METYDMIMVGVLAGAVIWGLWKGLAWQIASLASFVGSYVLSFFFRLQLAQFLNVPAPWNIFLSMLILYVGTSLVIWVIFNVMSSMIDGLKLADFDKQLGGVFGLVKGLVLCSVITLFAVSLLGDEMAKKIISTKSGYYIAYGLDRLDMVIPAEWHSMVHPYLHLDPKQPGLHEGLASPNSAPNSNPTSAPNFGPSDGQGSAGFPSGNGTAELPNERPFR